MGTLETLFAVVVSVLAAAAVLGALVFAVVWEVAAIRRVIDRHRKPDPEELFWRSQRALNGPQ
jgi:hypothetical protein